MRAINRLGFINLFIYEAVFPRLSIREVEDVG